MRESSLPDPRLRRALEQIDLLKRESRTERVRSGNLRHALAKAQRLAAAKPKPEHEQRGGVLMRHRRNLRPREQAPLPPAKIATMPMAFCPDTGRLIAPWATHSEADQQQLRGAIDQIADLDAVRVPVWLFPDDRPPVPIAAASLRHWLVQYESGRAVYITRRAMRSG